MPELEQERMDVLLSRALSSTVPTLSAGFDRQLADQLRPKRLPARARVGLTMYGAFAMVASIWAMRAASIEWSLVAVSVVVPLVAVALVFQRIVRRPALS